MTGIFNKNEPFQIGDRVVVREGLGLARIGRVEIDGEYLFPHSDDLAGIELTLEHVGMSGSTMNGCPKDYFFVDCNGERVVLWTSFSRRIQDIVEPVA